MTTAEKYLAAINKLLTPKPSTPTATPSITA
jgi:hypothetical protein